MSAQEKWKHFVIVDGPALAKYLLEHSEGLAEDLDCWADFDSGANVFDVQTVEGGYDVYPTFMNQTLTSLDPLRVRRAAGSPDAPEATR